MAYDRLWHPTEIIILYYHLQPLDYKWDTLDMEAVRDMRCAVYCYLYLGDDGDKAKVASIYEQPLLYYRYCLSKSMKSFDENRIIVRERLKKHRAINSLFGQSLIKRMEFDNWLDNQLVQILIKETNANISMITEVIDKVKKINPNIIEEVKKELSGKDKQYDRRMNDFLSELRAVIWLDEREYCNIEKISRSKLKSPDFRCKRDSTLYLVEVKNLRAQSEFFEIVLNRAMALQFIYDDICNKGSVYLEVEPDDLSELDVTDRDHYNIELFLKKLLSAIQSKQGNVHHSYYAYEVNTRTIRTIKANISESDSYNCMASFRKYGINLSDSKRQLSILIPLFRKVLKVLENATHQFYSYDANNDYSKLPLINWEKSTEYLLDTDSEKRFYSVIKGFNNNLDVVVDNLEIEIMQD